MNQGELVVIHGFPVWLPQTQTWMFTLIKHLPELVESHIVCERTQNLDQFELPNIHALIHASRLQYYWEKGLRNMKVRFASGFLAEIANKTGANIVHSHFGHIGWSNLGAVRISKARHIVSFYGTDVSLLPTRDKKWKTRYRDLFEQADVFLCEGPFMAGRVAALGCPEGKIMVHSLGVDVRNIPYQPRRLREDEPLRVLIAASFREKKGIPYALNALAQLNIPVEITIVGDASRHRDSQQEKRRIVETIHASGLADRVRMLGYQPYGRLLELAYKHHVYLQPSLTAPDGDTEGGAPVTLIEMIASGMPVVSTRHCDIPNVVHYGMDDWLVEERDVSGIVDRLMWLVQNPTWWDKLLSSGRHHIEQEFDAPRQGVRLEAIYRSLPGVVIAS